MGYVGAHRSAEPPLGFRPAYLVVGLLVIGGWTAGAALTIGDTPTRQVQRQAEAFGLSAFLGPGAEQPAWPYSVDSPPAPAGPPADPRPTSIRAEPVAALDAGHTATAQQPSYFTPLVPQLPPPAEPAPVTTLPWRTTTTTAPSTPRTTAPTTTAPTSTAPASTDPATAEPTAQPSTTQPTTAEPTSRPELTSTTPPPAGEPTVDDATTRDPDPADEDQDRTTT